MLQLLEPHPRALHGGLPRLPEAARPRATQGDVVNKEVQEMPGQGAPLEPLQGSKAPETHHSAIYYD